MLFNSIDFFIFLPLLFVFYWLIDDILIESFTFFGQELRINTLNIILSLGISFYTYQTLSYSMDFYNKKLEPTKDFVGFMAFVSFFPQFVAEPTVRGENLSPQFSIERKFNYRNAVDGLSQVL